jgi:hypothetical protein
MLGVRIERAELDFMIWFHPSRSSYVTPIVISPVAVTVEDIFPATRLAAACTLIVPFNPIETGIEPTMNFKSVAEGVSDKL